QFVAELQAYNRYTYVLNNPLSYNDPTGYFISKDFDALVNFALGVAGAIACVSNPLACTLISIAATIYNSTSALAAHASVGQVAISSLVGLVGGQLGGFFSGPI